VIGPSTLLLEAGRAVLADFRVSLKITRLKKLEEDEF